MPRGTEEKGRVLLHARPLLPGEHNALTTGALCVSDDGKDVMVQLAPGRSKTFEVDGSLLLPSPLPADAGSPPGPSPLSAEAASLVHSLFSGINGTLLCHGSAGSGKTHTLFGSASAPGLLDAVLDGIFELFDNNRCILHVSVEELHMERFTDLLLHDANSASRPRWGGGERRPDTTLVQHGSPLRDSSSIKEGGHRSPRSSSRIPGRLSLSTAQPLSPHSLRSLGHSLKLPLTHSEVCRTPHMASKAAARPPGLSATQHGGSSSSTPARESRIPVFSSSGVPSPPYSSSSPPVGGGSKIPHPQATSSSSTNGLGTPARVCRQLVPPRSPGHGPEQHTPTSHMLPSRPRHTAGEAAAGSSPAALLSSPAAATTPQSASAQHARYACVCQPVTSSAEAKRLIHTGLQRRLAATPAAPGCSSSSHSRAHVIVTLTLQQQQAAGSGQSEDAAAAAADSGTRLVGQLHLVDLASSENLRNGGSAHSQGAAVINQSLCHLNRVLEMLFRGARVPTYRNSKLTHRLQESLGGRSRLLLVACISTVQSQLAETVETLRFGALVRAVSNMPAVNGTGQGTLVKRLREQLAAQQDALQQQSSKVSELQQVVEQQAQQLQALQALLAARQQQQLAPAEQEQQAGTRSHKQHADEGWPPQALAALKTAVSPLRSTAASPAADSPRASLAGSESGDVNGEGASQVERQAVQGLTSAAGNEEGVLAAAATSAAAAEPPAAAAPLPATVAVRQQHRPVSPAPTPAAVSAIAAALRATLAAGDAGSSRLRPPGEPATPTTPGAAQGSAWEAASMQVGQHSNTKAGPQEEEQEEGGAEESSDWGSPGLLSKFLAAGRGAFSPRASGYQAVPATHPCDSQDTFSLLEALADQMAHTAAEVAHTAAEASSCGSSRTTSGGGGRRQLCGSSSSSNGGGADELGMLRRRTSSKGGAAGLLQQQQQEEEAVNGQQASPCVSSHSGAEAQAEDSWRSWKQAQADDEAAAQPESEPENPGAAAEQPDSSAALSEQSALAAHGAKQAQVRQQRQHGAASVLNDVDQQ